MDLLTQSDLQHLLAFAADCYKLRPPEEFARHIVNALSSLVPAEHITYNEMDLRRLKSENCVNTPELATPAAARTWEQQMHDHPVVAYMMRTGDCQAVRISDFLTPRQLHSRGLYCDFYRDLGIEDALCFNLSCQAPNIVGVGLHRGRPFSDRERLIIELVRPHILQAWSNAKAISQTQSELQLANQGMEHLGSGAIVCTAEWQLQSITPLAQSYLAEYFGATSDRYLPQELLRWAKHQNAQLLFSDSPPARLPLAIDRAGKRLLIRLLSNRGANLLLMEEVVTAPDASLLVKLGLTRRESEVLAWVAQGKTNSDIASILAMNPRTVKKHLEHIFQKLGVETRTAAAALAFEAASTKKSAKKLD